MLNPKHVKKAMQVAGYYQLTILIIRINVHIGVLC